jgi:hypothetical protein
MSHCPAVQMGVEFAARAHARPQMPQLSTSVAVFRQEAPHGPKPLLQVIAQRPLVQSAAPFAGTGQAWPHAPQFAGSLWVATHDDPHEMAGGGHASTHCPPEQA